ncbi:MAG: DUF2384 domain-containing protein [Oceanospirillaceae bacterium]|nr:DUF2384 domain-containing protein [Oceanospirillaceae bacterium]
MSSVQKAEKSAVLMKAFNNACDAMRISGADKSNMLGVNASTLSRNSIKGFSPDSKTGELQLHFIRLYRSLFAIAGGDNEFMYHWYSTNNAALNGVPAVLCLSIEGLFRTNQYLDAMRGKV